MGKEDQNRAWDMMKIALEAGKGHLGSEDCLEKGSVYETITTAPISGGEYVVVVKNTLKEEEILALRMKTLPPSIFKVEGEGNCSPFLPERK